MPSAGSLWQGWGMSDGNLEWGHSFESWVLENWKIDNRESLSYSSTVSRIGGYPECVAREGSIYCCFLWSSNSQGMMVGRADLGKGDRIMQGHRGWGGKPLVFTDSSWTQLFWFHLIKQWAWMLVSKGSSSQCVAFQIGQKCTPFSASLTTGGCKRY